MPGHNMSDHLAEGGGLSLTYLFFIDARVSIVHVRVLFHPLRVASGIAVQLDAIRRRRNHRLALHIMLICARLLRLLLPSHSGLLRGVLGAEARGHVRGGVGHRAGMRLQGAVAIEVHGEALHRGRILGMRWRFGCRRRDRCRCRGSGVGRWMHQRVLMLLQPGMRCWSVPLEIGKMHVELEEVGEFVFSGSRNEIILMKLLRPGHGRLLLHGCGRENPRDCLHGAAGRLANMVEEG